MLSPMATVKTKSIKAASARVSLRCYLIHQSAQHHVYEAYEASM